MSKMNIKLISCLLFSVINRPPQPVVSTVFPEFLSLYSGISRNSVNDATVVVVRDQRPSMGDDSTSNLSIENAVAPNFQDSKTAKTITDENADESLTTKTANALSNEGDLNLYSESEKKLALKSETYENANIIEGKEIDEIFTTQTSSMSHQKGDMDLLSESENSMTWQLEDSYNATDIVGEIVDKLITGQAVCTSQREDALDYQSKSENDLALKPENFENAKLIGDKNVNQLSTTQAVNTSNEKDILGLQNKHKNNLSLKSEDVTTAKALFGQDFDKIAAKQTAIFYFDFAIFILHSQESELNGYTLYGTSALAWELPTCHLRYVWATCLPHKGEGVPSSALPKDTTSKLAGLFFSTSPKCRAPSREAVDTIF